MQKNLDYIATPQSSKPPRVPGGDIEGSEGSFSNEPSVREIAATAVSWENPLLSGILSIAGVLIAFLGDYLLKGKHGVPLLSGELMLLLISAIILCLFAQMVRITLPNADADCNIGYTAV